MTDLSLATVHELVAELDKRLLKMVVIGENLDDMRREQSFLLTGHATSITSSMGLVAWSEEVLRVRARSTMNNSTGLYGG